MALTDLAPPKAPPSRNIPYLRAEEQGWTDPFFSSLSGPGLIESHPWRIKRGVGVAGGEPSTSL